MQAEIVMIGTELLIGQIVDTNATFLAKSLADNGINLYFKTTVGDNFGRITSALDIALNRADVVLTSGGLGPTEDDITRECIAELLGRPLEFRPDLFAQLEARFSRFRRPMTENNKKQACAPRGAIGIENPHGTAPGLIVEDERGTIIAMPGVPSELKPMMTDSVLPYLRRRFGLSGVLRARVLKVCGVGESRVDDIIGDLIRNQQNPTVGVLASPEFVRIRIMARADSADAADRLIDPVDAEIRRRLPGLVMGVNDDTLEGAVDAVLRAVGWRLAVGETLTGGVVAQRLTSVDAASLAGALVRPRASLPGGGGAPAALELAHEVRETFDAECGLALVSDPRDRTCHIAFVTPEGQAVWESPFWEAEPVSQLRAAVTALEQVRRHLVALRPV